jgi:hypothetical protein
MYEYGSVIPQAAKMTCGFPLPVKEPYLLLVAAPHDHACGPAALVSGGLTSGALPSKPRQSTAFRVICSVEVLRKTRGRRSVGPDLSRLTLTDSVG